MVDLTDNSLEANIKTFFHDSPVTHLANPIFVYKLHSYLNHSIETNAQIVYKGNKKVFC